MKKRLMKVIIFSVLIILAIMYITNRKVDAATIDMNYMSADENKNINKINAGDEFLVSVSINGDESDKVMAIFGYLEYDSDILELVKEDGSENIAKIKLGNGWSIGNVSDEESSNPKKSKFLIYSDEESRENTAVYIRFKVKENVNTKRVKNAIVQVKDVTLYDTEHKELKSKVENSLLTVNFSKIGKINKTDKYVSIISTIVIIIIIIIIIGGKFFEKKQEEQINSEKSNENKKTMKNENNKEKE